MESFADGVRIFRTRIFPKRRHLFEALAQGQEPEALFITCADSRIVASLITHTQPGRLFVERNPGNIVPIYSEESVGVSASIEYAVEKLHVPQIIICGHSDCGAMRGILQPERLTPAVKRWLDYAAPALERIQGSGARQSGIDLQQAVTYGNVLLQMEHLETHPSVKRRLEKGDLKIYGWVYHIHSGLVEAYNPASGKFEEWPPLAER